MLPGRWERYRRSPGVIGRWVSFNWTSRGVGRCMSRPFRRFLGSARYQAAAASSHSGAQMGESFSLSAWTARLRGCGRLPGLSSPRAPRRHYSRQGSSRSPACLCTRSAPMASAFWLPTIGRRHRLHVPDELVQALCDGRTFTRASQRRFAYLRVLDDARRRSIGRPDPRPSVGHPLTAARLSRLGLH